jgi:exo-beta-1,3-glucanase (GH17 family)
MDTAADARMLVFVCYSRENREWFEKYPLIPFLESSVAQKNVQLWFDLSHEGIGAGEVWREKIRGAIEQSSIAILLISQDFLNSRVIRTFELPLIEERANKGLLRVMPVLVGYCDYSTVPFLEERNILPVGRPLIEYVGDDAKWGRVRHEILKSLESLIDGVSGSTIPRPAPRYREPQEEVRATSQGGPNVRRRAVIGALGGAAVASVAGGAWFLSTRSAVPPERVRERASFFGALPWLNWIIYDPTDYDPLANRFPSEASMRTDLRVLRQHGFNGLVTTTLQGTLLQIPRIAHEEGFLMVIGGVWNPTDDTELAPAIDMAEYIDAYCIGHSGLSKRYRLVDLQDLTARVSRATGRPVSVSELVADYETTPALVNLGDFMFPDAHGQWHGGEQPDEVWAETVALGRKLASLPANSDRSILLKMVSYPSGGASGLTLESQLMFYRFAVENVRNRTDMPSRVKLAFLGAFDTPWKSPEAGWAPSEQHTGLFTHSRDPKPAVTDVAWTKAR